MNLRVRLDRPTVSARERSIRYALVTIEAATRQHARARRAVDLAFVLDRSGSMAGTKMTLGRRAIDDALRLLRRDDRFALVVFDDEVSVVGETAMATRDARAGAMRRLAALDARGSTDLCGGWQAGLASLARSPRTGVVRRVLLVTDGLANVGASDPDTLVARAAEWRARGIGTSTFGVGADFDERLLQRMAVAGGGHFYFIERAEQIRDLLTSELGETLAVVARDAALVCVAGPGVDVAPLCGFTAWAAGAVTRIELGDLVSGQEVSLLMQITTEPGATESPTVSVRTVCPESTEAAGAIIVLAPVPDAEAAGVRRDPIVTRAVADYLAALARLQALEKNGIGDYESARRVLHQAVTAILALADGDRAVIAVAEALRAETGVFEAALAPMDRKRRHFAGSAALMSRGPEGRARRNSA